VEAVVDTTPGATDTPGRLLFKTTADGAGGALSERMRIDSSGNVGVGTTGSLFGKLVISDAGASGLEILPNYPGGGAGTSILSYNRSGAAYINSAIDGLSHTFRLSGTDNFKIDSSGNARVLGPGGLGYGTGSGGTVTQITSKTTGVTLNKTNGQITTTNAAIAANANASFTVTNSTVAATDTIILTKVSGGTSSRYTIMVTAVAAGSFEVTIINNSASSQSDVVVVNFAVIKAVTS
jgi:hypothetical protein